jgi:hypothetical protein
MSRKSCHIGAPSPCTLESLQMNAITFIWPWHLGQQSGSISYTRLMSIAQVWLARPGAATSGVSPLDAAPACSAASAALRRIPRALFE